MVDLLQVLECCKQLAADAGEAIMEIYRQDFTVDYKEDKSPLTRADLAADKIICEGLQHAFSNVAILSEERRDDKTRLQNPWCFIVDPLDGTKQFVEKNGQFTVNIALAYQGEVAAGVVGVPAKEELYYAAKGVGAFHEVIGHKKTALATTGKTRDLIAVTSRSHCTPQERDLLDRHRQLIAAEAAYGSSLKGCMVAAGVADIYYRYGPTSEWDTAAMQCIVEQAGGIFRQWDGTPMRYNRENTRNEQGFFAVNREENIWV